MRESFFVSVGIRPGHTGSQHSSSNLLFLLPRFGRFERHTQTSQSIDPINVHRTAPTNALSATPSKRQRRIDFILDPDQRIQHHRPRLVQIKRIRLHLRLRCRLIRVPAVDLESLGLGLWAHVRVLDVACL